MTEPAVQKPTHETGGAAPDANRPMMRKAGDLTALVSALNPALLQHAQRFFLSRKAAASAGAGRLRPSLRRICTLEDTAEGVSLVIRGPNRITDPLFPGYPFWGRLDVIALAPCPGASRDHPLQDVTGDLAVTPCEGSPVALWQAVAPHRMSGPVDDLRMAGGRWWRRVGDTGTIDGQIRIVATLRPVLLPGPSFAPDQIPATCHLVLTQGPARCAWVPLADQGTEPRPDALPPADLPPKSLPPDSLPQGWCRIDLLGTGGRLTMPRTAAAAMLCVEDDCLVLRSASSRVAALNGRAPFWGIDKAVPLDGSDVTPTIDGVAETGRTLTLQLAREPALSCDISWQCHQTGEGPDGWAVIPGATSPTLWIPADLTGAWLRVRIRGAATGRRWAVSDSLGPVTDATTTAPNGLPQPMDLSPDPAFRPGSHWLGKVRAALPLRPAAMTTTYAPAENVIHPCVVAFRQPFRGYRYLCAITAYPRGPAFEDPFVHGSNDGVNWTLLTGVPQPLDVRKPVPGAYNSDTFITHDPQSGQLVVGYRSYEPRTDASPSASNADVVLKCRSTGDGHRWSAPVELMRRPADDMIMLSPTMIFDPAGGLWHMWTIDRPSMHHWTAPALTGPWSLDSAAMPLGMFRMPHHHEVKWVGDRLVCLLYARGSGNLYFGIFRPGSWTDIDWSTEPVLDPRPASLYKASFVPVHDADAGTLAFDLWWTMGAAGPAGGTDPGHGRRLQYARSSAVRL